MAKKPKVEVDEEAMRQMIAGLIPQTADITREVTASPEQEENLEEIVAAETSNHGIAAIPKSAPTNLGNTSASVPPGNWRRKSVVLPDYERTFLVPADYNIRASIYVSAETKRKILEIVKKIGSERLTATSFVDNILRHHIAVFRDDINRLYKARNHDTLV